MRIGFAYDSPVQDKGALSPGSVVHEYEEADTIDWIRGVLATLGEVVDMPWGEGFVSLAADQSVDVIFNITEAAGSRNRESLVPGVAEALGIPFSGSDAVCLGLTLDKTYTKVVARHLGIPTPDFVKIDGSTSWDQESRRLAGLPFPLIAKPNTGGSSLGIRESCRVHDTAELRDAVDWILEDCGDAALVERFIPGRELDCGLLEADGLKALPVAELVFDGGNPDLFNSIERKTIHDREIVCPAQIPEPVAEAICSHTTALYRFFQCRDLARADYRLSADGVPYFLEINPLPGLGPFRSVLPAMARSVGMTPEDVILQMVRNALKRRRHARA